MRNKKRLEIGLDFDGVISNCGQLKSETAKILYGKNIPPEKFKKEIIIGEGHLTAEQYRALQKRIYGTRETGMRMQPVKDVLKYLPRLISLGHDILVVTSRDQVELEIAKEWCQLKGLNLKFVGVGYKASKAEACRGRQIYIDDDLDKLIEVAQVVPHRFLFSWGYNREVEVGCVAQRISSWAEFFYTVPLLDNIQ